MPHISGYENRVIEILKAAEMPLNIENVRKRAGIRNWQTAKNLYNYWGLKESPIIFLATKYSYRNRKLCVNLHKNRGRGGVRECDAHLPKPIPLPEHPAFVQLRDKW